MRNVGWIRDPVAFEMEKTQALDREMKIRAREEMDSTQGEPVWFSRHIEHGDLKHWVLYTHGKKYELRLPDDRHFIGTAMGSGLSTSKIELRIDQWDQEKELFLKRQQMIDSQGKPHVEGFYICLIGWTNKAVSEVDQLFHDMKTGFGSYNILFNNCQHFVKKFSDRILVPRKASDYNWFRENIETTYQRLLNLPPTAEIVRYQLQMIKNAVASNVANQNALQQQQQQQQMQNILNIQQQAIISSQINNAALNPALNPAMNSAMNPAMNPAIMC